ncbi:endonuclease III domain-containing protein [Chloroflexota bacterium]
MKPDLLHDAFTYFGLRTTVQMIKYQSQIKEILLEVYHILVTSYGPQHWWPGESAFEVMVGAILTQSVSWTNVEKAISNLKAKSILSPELLRRTPIVELADTIRPCGYYNAKARKLKSLASWLGDYCQDDLSLLSQQAKSMLREQLLKVNGIGQETADSILLYACNKPSFVIDAYTRRIIDRLEILDADYTYDSYQALFSDNLPPDVELFNEYHALMVRHGKDTCRKVPLCIQCCLNTICSYTNENKQS